MTDTITLRKLVESLPQEAKEWFQLENKWCIAGEAFDAQKYIAAANPTAIIAMLDEIDSLRAALAQQAEQVQEHRTLYECRGCRHIYMDKVTSCDCMENSTNEYNEWVATPNKN